MRKKTRKARQANQRCVSHVLVGGGGTELSCHVDGRVGGGTELSCHVLAFLLGQQGFASLPSQEQTWIAAQRARHLWQQGAATLACFALQQQHALV